MADPITNTMHRLIVVASIMCMSVAVRSQPVAAQDAVRAAWPSVVPGETVVTRKIRSALDGPTQMEFDETPLGEALDFLKELHGIEFQIDTTALDNIGVGSDTPLTMTCRDISLRSGLKLFLESMGTSLTFTIRDEVVWITTRDAEPRQRRVYNVAKLLGEQESSDELAAVLSQAIENVGPRKIQVTPFGRLLIVNGVQSSHEQLAETFGQSRPTETLGELRYPKIQS